MQEWEEKINIRKVTRTKVIEVLKKTRTKEMELAPPESKTVYWLIVLMTDIFLKMTVPLKEP